jgi:signal peptidase I
MDTQNLTPEAEVSEEKKKNPLWDFFTSVELLAVAAAAVLLFFTFVARITVVEGGSMENTLAGGDKLIVSDIFYTPERGDIVIIQSPTVNGGEAIVKRVIAVGGDTVAIKHDGVYVNGERLSETDGSLGYTAEDCTYLAKAPIKVKEGHVYVLGDHRSVSYDSRSFGTVDERAVIGKVLLRVSPFSSFGTVD